jgi:hypothetical protein
MSERRSIVEGARMTGTKKVFTQLLEKSQKKNHWATLLFAAYRNGLSLLRPVNTVFRYLHTLCLCF